MRILFVGDIVGKPGRRMLADRLPAIRRTHRPDYVIVNGENAAGGTGLTPATARELFALGIDVMTLGNHTWDKRELIPEMDEFSALLRPLNFPPGTPGRGWLTTTRPGLPALAVVNAMGRVYANVHLDCPFRGVEEALADIGGRARVVVLDFHAEATSEKTAMGWFLDGRVTAVLGTHTHVPTADAMLLPGGTAYQTDVGMTGPWVGCLGVEREPIIQRFQTQMPVRFNVAEGPCQLNAVLVDADADTGLATAIQPLIEREALPPG